MQILVVSATSFEVESLRSEIDGQKLEVNSRETDSKLKTQGPELLITGVGMVATAFTLGRHLATHQYDLAINLGIAGSFDKNIALGDVVEVTEDQLSEFGAEDGEAFLPIELLGFGESMFNSTASLSDFGQSSLKKVKAITVNTVHGHEPSIKKLAGRTQPQLESMEGAAFFYACKQAGISCLQIRAVSNYVEKRNRDAWQIGLAIKNLNSFATGFIKEVLRST